MAGRKLTPFVFRPRTVADALDGGLIPPGGLTLATNLIFDPSNPFCLQCRPAAVSKSNFTYTGGGVVSVAYQVGDICYGLVSSSANAGKDEPFAFNVTTNTKLSVSGITSGNVPTTPATTGAWVPPTMALVGTLLYVTHPGFPNGSNYFGWFDISTPASPVWHAGNTTTNALPSVPVAVGSFNNRAWFACVNALYFTDALTTTITNASQVLTVGGTETITGLAPMPLTTSVQGIIQSLAVFKDNLIALVTGDSTDNNLALNIISSSVGTSAPRTIAVCPKALVFMAVDGIRKLLQDGTLEDPEPSLKIPFVYALTPSRASGNFCNNIYRITVQNGLANGSPFQEYWYDFRWKGWTGPHTFTQDMAVPYLNQFVTFRNTQTNKLWVSQTVQDGTSTFTENGSQLTFIYETAPMPDEDDLYENSAVLSTIDLSIPSNADAYTLVASDVTHGVLGQATITAPDTGDYWGAFDFGTGVWTPNQLGLDGYNIPWNTSLVFSRLIVRMVGDSSFNFKVSKLIIGYQPLRYKAI